MFLLFTIDGLRVFIHQRHLAVLKQVKQVHLQLLEVQASLRKLGTDKI